MNISPPFLSRYCLHILRESDFDRYIACLFAPAPKRAALAVIWAFNFEIAKIVEQVKDPLIGELRLRWWCDEIEKISSTSPLPQNDAQNPLLCALTQAIQQYELSIQDFVAACEARIDMLYGQVSPLSPDFEHYSHATSGVFFQMACQILTSQTSETIALTCSHAGQADTLWRFWRWQAIHEKPLQEEDAAWLLDNKVIMATIIQHYDKFAHHLTQLPRLLRPAFLPLAPVGAHLRRLSAASSPDGAFDEAKHSFSSLRRLWLIGRTALTGHF